jgi:hypothetical protein
MSKPSGQEWRMAKFITIRIKSSKNLFGKIEKQKQTKYLFSLN